jgi:tetratricopeptide (TPR) repeat protein
MAPEQARGHTVDHRADIYAFGLMLSDMLIGRRQTGHGGESSLAALMNRMTTVPPPLRSVDPNIPQAVSDVVSRCIALDPEQRYAKTKELLRDLESLDSHGHPTDGTTAAATHAWTQPLPTHTFPGQAFPGQTMPGQTMPGQTMPGTAIPAPAAQKSKRLWFLIAAGVFGLALGTGAFLFRDRLFSGGGRAATTRSVAIAILPFRNGSGDPSLDNLGPTIAAQLRTEFGQAEAIRAVDSGQIAQLLSDLRISPDANLDPNTTKRIASYTSATVVVLGSFQTFGDQIQITANLQDLSSNQSIPVTVQAANRSQLLATIGQLAAGLREKLTLAPDVVKALEASSYRPSTKSVEALQHYNEGLVLLRDGKLLEARKAFEASAQQDSDFALAYARLAQTYAALGLAPEAEKQARKAESLSAGLQNAEKFLIQATTARILKNRAEAVSFYEKLLAILPGDDVLADLASAYEENWDFEKAHASYTKLISRDKKNLDALIGLGRIENRRGQSKAALEPLSQALIIATDRNNDEAKATAKEWIGVTYRLMNRPDEALSNFRDALDLAKRLGRKRMEAEIIHETGKVQQTLGRLDDAFKSYEESRKLREAINDRQGVGDTLIDFGNLYSDRGQVDKALAAYRESLTIQREQKNDNYIGLVESNIGAMQFLKGENQDALTWYQQALAIREKYKNPVDIADTVYNLGDTYVRLGQYSDAETQYIRALKLRRDANDQRGEAQVAASLGIMFGYKGRLDAAVSSTKQAYDAMVASKERNGWTVFVFAAYGNALISVGREDQGRKVLDDAAKLAKELKIAPLEAMVLNYQGDQLAYRGDFQGARPVYEQAVQLGTQANDPYFTAWSKANRAIASAKTVAASAAGDLKNAVPDADKFGLKYQAIQCSIALGESFAASKQYAQAKQELENALAASDKYEMLVLRAQSRYALSQVLAATGDGAGARQQLQEAKSLLEKIKTEAKGDAILKRADLAPIAAAK